jgi:aryl-alcohol dehydrogenase-like predicted oxidoreductase
VVLSSVAKLKPIAERVGLSMAQLSLAWVLRLPAVSSAIIGASRPEQVTENAAASGVRLPDSVIQEMEAAIAPAIAS